MLQKKEIVLLGLHMGLGGAERVFSELSNEWVNMGYKVTVIQARPNTGIKNYKINSSIELIDLKFPKNGLRRIKQTKELINIMKNKKGAVVVAFMVQTQLLAALSSFFINNRIVCAERNDPARNPSNRLLRFGRNLTYELADICVFQTNEEKEYFSKRIQKKGYVIKNPLHPNLPKPFEGEKRKTVVAVARLEEQKNLPLLINAFEEFSKKHSDYTLEIYGDGSLKNALNDMIEKKGLKNKVKLMGFSMNVYSDINDCTMFVSSSNYEGISNAMLEALGLGLPTICTDCPAGGARETIVNNKNGILIPVRDEESLVNAMTSIADNPGIAEELSKNAIKIRDELDVKRIAKQWIEVMFNE